MEDVFKTVGTVATVVTGAELFTQSIYPEQKGFISYIVKDDTQQRVIKAAASGLALAFITNRMMVKAAAAKQKRN